MQSNEIFYTLCIIYDNKKTQHTCLHSLLSTLPLASTRNPMSAVSITQGVVGLTVVVVGAGVVVVVVVVEGANLTATTRQVERKLVSPERNNSVYNY